MNRKLYNKIPKVIGNITCKTSEYFTYTYMPIKLTCQHGIIVEPRLLNSFAEIIGKSCCDYIGSFGLDNYVNSYVYITAKHLNQRNGGFNRPGWHSDGFGTEDISYIWSNCQPTVFNSGNFYLSDDDVLSMNEMEEQANDEFNYTFPDNSLIRMDQFSIHRVASEYVIGDRMFVKICISKDIYRLRGNSVNHMLDYSWDYIERKKHRNVPQQS